MPTKKSAPIIGNRFLELRKILKKTQKELAENIGDSQAHLSQIERGEAMPTFNFQNKLAEKYPEINFNWLFYGEGSPLRTYDQQRITKQAEEVGANRVEKDLQKKISKLMEKNEQLEKDNSKLINLIGKKIG